MFYKALPCINNCCSKESICQCFVFHPSTTHMKVAHAFLYTYLLIQTTKYRAATRFSSTKFCVILFGVWETFPHSLCRLYVNWDIDVFQRNAENNTKHWDRRNSRKVEFWAVRMGCIGFLVETLRRLTTYWRLLI